MAFLKLLKKTAFSVLKSLLSHWRIWRKRKGGVHRKPCPLPPAQLHRLLLNQYETTFPDDFEERRHLESDECSFVTVEETSQEEGIVWATPFIPSLTLGPHHSEDLLPDIDDDGDDWYVPVLEEKESVLGGFEAEAARYSVTPIGHVREVEEVAQILARLITLMQQTADSDYRHLQDVVMESMLDVDGQE